MLLHLRKPRGSSTRHSRKLQLVSRSWQCTLAAIRFEGAINNRSYRVAGRPNCVRAMGSVCRVIWRKRTIAVNGKLIQPPYTHYLW